MSDLTWTRNRRVLIHEAETPMRGHNGLCCVYAISMPLPDEREFCASCPFASCADCKYQPDHDLTRGNR